MSEKKGPARLRKITGKGVGFNLASVRAALDALPKGKDEAPLYTVLGIVNGARPGASELGDYVRLVGDFKATNLSTGDVYVSTVAILPNFVGEAIGMAAMRPDSQGVQFALTMFAKKVPDSVVGFEYTCEDALPPSESSPLAMLEKQLNEQKLLPAPKK